MEVEESSEDLLVQLNNQLPQQTPMDVELDEESSAPVYKFMNGEISFNDYLNEMEQVNEPKDAGQDTPKKESLNEETIFKPVDKKKSQKTKRSKLSATLRAFMGQANVFYARGDTQAAVKMCLEIIREAPEASEPFKMLSTVYEEMDENEKSLQMRLIAALLGPTSKEEWVELAQVLRKKSEFRQAVICLTRAINLDELNISLYEERAEMMKLATVSCVEAYGYPRLLFKLDPKKHGPTILYLCKKVAQIYYGDKKYEKTISTLKYAFDNCPELITVVEANLYLDVLTMTRNYQECLNILITFCNIDMTLDTSDDNTRVTKCVVPDDLPIDIRAKLIIALICSDSTECALLQINILLTENPDDAGDLFWDVGLILWEKKLYSEAIRVLVPLTNTQNFNSVALWLKLTSCYKGTGQMEECLENYRKALEYFPEDRDLRLKFCDELISAQRYEEAVEVTRSDGNDISSLIHERCKLFLLLKDDDNFLESGWQLFRLHCKEVKTSDDYIIFSSVYGIAKNLNSTLSQYVPTTFDESVSLEEEWKIYWKMCQLYVERGEYDMFLLLTVSVHVSFKFIPMRNDLKMPLIVGCIMNNNYELGFDVVRDIVHLGKSNTNRLWNTLYMCSLRTEYSRLHKFVIRFLKKHPDEDRAVMMYANDSLYAGTYKYSLNDHTILYQKYKTPLLALLVAVNFLHISCQKFTTSKHALVAQTLAFFSKYEQLRGDDAFQEVYYNVGRLFHQLQLLPQAIYYYKKALNCKPAINNDMFDLKRDIAYNLHLIYLFSNQPKIANISIENQLFDERRIGTYLDALKINIMSSPNYAERTLFRELCKTLEEISKKQSHAQKENVMRQLISEFHKRKPHPDENFYPILRLLLPHLERERSYGLKQHTLGKIYLNILCLSEQSKDAQKLKSYNESTSKTDFADVMFWILKLRYDNKGDLTVYDVNSHLDNIALKNANHDRSGMETELQTMINKMTATEQKWLIRILLKNLHLSVSQKKMLAMFHPDANDLFDVSNNLQKVCSMLKDPSIRYNEIVVNVFEPFKPMLSQQCDVQHVNRDIKGSEAYYVEIKFDGERFQIHMRDDEFKYFSRNGFEFTNNYGCNASNGILTPKLAKQLSPSVKSCILDGEMMCWNTRKKTFTTKVSDIDVKSLKVGHVHQPCFVVFDILYYNGQILTNEPLKERFKLLEEIIQHEEGVIMISDKEVVTSGDKILELLNLAIENCEEGIVVKNPNSVYKFNSRNSGWYKIKPEYTEGMMEELDLLIIGGYYGGGRRKGVIAKFLLGMADPKKNEKDEPIKFYSVARVGSGYSDQELDELNRKLEKFWKKTKGSERPLDIEWTKDKPDVWLKPSDSIILQVKATEVQKSDQFKIEHTLRFPRVVKIRYDKPWYDCYNTDQYNRVGQAYSGKLTSNHNAKLNDAGSSKEKKIKRNITKPSLEESSSSKKIRKDEVVSTLFHNKEMCVIQSEGFSKPDLEVKIMQHGGTIVQNPSENTFCVVAGEMSVRVNNIARLKKYDVVKPTWLHDCIEKNTLRRFYPDDLLVVSTSTSEMLSEEYDSNGDSYTEELDRNGLERLVDSIKIEENATTKEMIKLDKEMFGGRNLYALFRGCTAYFHDVYENLNQKFEVPVLKTMFQFHGGEIVSEINRSTTHIITFTRFSATHTIHSLGEEKKLFLHSRANLTDEFWKRNLSNNVPMVDSTWITDSWNAKRLLNISKYRVRC